MKKKPYHLNGFAKLRDKAKLEDTKDNFSLAQAERIAPALIASLVAKGLISFKKSNPNLQVPHGKKD